MYNVYVSERKEVMQLATDEERINDTFPNNVVQYKWSRKTKKK
jgi:hypothetical protein